MAGVERILVEVRGPGRASASILDIAAQKRIELIVIPVRRRSRVGKLVLGSTAQDVILGADCTVLTVNSGAEQGD